MSTIGRHLTRMGTRPLPISFRAQINQEDINVRFRKESNDDHTFGSVYRVFDSNVVDASTVFDKNGNRTVTYRASNKIKHPKSKCITLICVTTNDYDRTVDSDFGMWFTLESFKESFVRVK